MTRKSSYPSLKEIAISANVSISSVSRVLNNVEPVSQEVKDKVNKAIIKLGRPRVSRSQHHGPWILYVAIPDDMNPYFTEIVNGIVTEANYSKFMVHVINVNGVQDPNSPYWKWIQKEPTIGGLIVIAGIFSDSDLEQFYNSFGKPMVVLHPWANTLMKVPTIKIDYGESIRMITQHLINLEHKKFAFLAGAPTTPDGQSPVIVDKLKGVRSSLHASNLELKDDMILEGPPTIDWGFQATKQLLSLPKCNQPTAIICSSDYVALGALHATRMSGFSVPKDISVVGFDDIAMAAHANPPLTTISVPKQRMGQLAVQIIKRLKDVSNTPLVEYYMLESPLIVRDSSGKANNKL